MAQKLSLGLAFGPAFILIASCNSETIGDSAANAAADAAISALAARQIGPFLVSELSDFDKPWAAAFEPGTDRLFITEKGGTIKFFDVVTGASGTVQGAPQVDYGGQGGLGDIAFAPDYENSGSIYLTWAEKGDGNTRGAALGRGQLVCENAQDCAIRDLSVIWRQSPKTTGRGHYSHRIAFSPDGEFLFLASGDRQKLEPAQDNSNTLGTIVRLTLDGSTPQDNPLIQLEEPSKQIWSWGHRNILGLAFAPDGRLWEVEHGPRGGDELNLVYAGQNYGWPIVSNGVHYSGKAIPDHATRPEFIAPAISWTPVIAPGDMIFYSGTAFPEWQGDALIAGLSSQALVRVELDGDKASEAERYDLGARLRAVDEGPDGALYVLEDGDDGRLLRLTPAS